MATLLISILSVYFFILIGFILKKRFTDRIDDQSLTLISIYGLQPLLAFWGIMIKPLDSDFVLAPVIYLGIILSVLVLLLLIGKQLFTDQKERSIFTVAPLIGNTGNLGIPLGIILFGAESAYYTNAINLANVFFVYTVGIFFYSLGNYTAREAMKNIATMPVLWVALLAVLLNLNEVTFSKPIMQGLQMGAYASMVVQLLLFGIYLASIRIQESNLKLMGLVNGTKFLLIPALGLIVLATITLDPMLKGIILLELIVPLALTNATLATLYHCKPNEVTGNILVSSLLFIFFSAVVLELLGNQIFAVH